MRFVKSDKPIGTKHAKLGEIEVDVEFPQVDSLDEFIQFAGGQQEALDYINSAVETAAKNGGRAALRNLAENADIAVARPKIQAIVKEYTPQSSGERAPSKKKAAAFDNVAALIESGKEFSREDLLAILAAAK